jgi:hypothetical protein
MRHKSNFLPVIKNICESLLEKIRSDLRPIPATKQKRKKRITETKRRKWKLVGHTLRKGKESCR